MNNASLTLLFLVMAVPLQAQSTSTSPTYSLLHAPPGAIASGGHVTAAGGTITAQLSTGNAIAGQVTNLTGMGVHEKPNLIGQLYDPTALTISASPTTIDETAIRQLAAVALMDDATTLPLDPASVVWSESSPHLTGIAPTGLATAAAVYQNEIANVGATWNLATDPDGLDLTILNTNPDNFGIYTADGLDDDWQVDNFGLANPDAAPTQNPDGDPNNNRTEFLAGFDPNDSTDFLQLTVDGFSAPTTLDLTINKLIPNRTYTLMASPDLGATTPFSPITPPFTVLTEQLDQPLQDTAAPTGSTYYQLQISSP